MNIQTMCVGPIETNCYFLEDSGYLAIIDPGDQAQDIQKAVEELGADPVYILLTHGHYDHTTAVPALHRAYPQAKIYIHQSDAYGAGTTMFPLIGQVEELLFYTEGDTLPLGTQMIEVLHTPGHSKGSVTLKVGDTLFCGDTLFAGSCGRTDLRGGSYEEILDSLGRLGKLEGDFRVLPGHGPETTLEEEREYNPYLRMGMGLD